MTPRPTSVDTELVLRLVMPGAAALPVRATMSYDVRDPYAVQVGFHTGSAEPGTSDVVEWTFARQLLTDGVAGAAGEGDVRVWPSTEGGAPAVCLSLSSPSGRALFEVPLSELVEFLGRTYAAVPTGEESAYVDVDAEMALLLWAEPET
jgi:hypothetical protein